MIDITAPVQPVGVFEDALERTARSRRSKVRSLTFGIFELDPDTDELRKEGRLIHLRRQPVMALRLLLERAGELVTRRELTEALWPDDIDVDVEQGLNHCMKEIRAILGDRPESPRFIQTLPRRGYRFLVTVQEALGERALPRAHKSPVDQKPGTPRDPEPDPWLADGRFE